MRVIDILDRVVELRDFIVRVSSWVIHLEVEIIQVRALKVIRVDKYMPRFRVQMVLVDPGLVILVRVCIMDLQVRESVHILLVILNEFEFLMVVLYVRSLSRRQTNAQKAKDCPRRATFTI